MSEGTKLKKFWRKVKWFIYSHIYSHIFWGLVLLFLGALGGWFIVPDGLGKHLLRGVMNSSIGAGIVTLGIKLILKARGERYKEPVRKFAWKSIRAELKNIIELIGEMAIDSAPVPWEDRPQNIESLLSDETATQICMHLDPTGSAPSGDEVWIIYLRDQFQQIDENLDKIIIKYGQFLPEKVLVPIEGLTIGYFFDLSEELAGLIERGEVESPSLVTISASLVGFFGKLRPLVQWFNSEFQECNIKPIGLPKNLSKDSPPSRVGENRIEPEREVEDDPAEDS